MKKKYKIQLPKDMVVKKDAHVEITDDFIYVNVELVKGQKYEPKDGDFVYIKAGFEHISIFKSIDGEKLSSYTDYCLSVDDVSIIASMFLCGTDDIKELRPATEEEKKLLIGKLAEVGKRWNEKEKRIEDIEYIPDDGDIVHILYGDTHEEIAIFYYRLQYEVSLPYYIVVGKEEDLLGHGCAYMLSKEEAGYKDIDESLRICKIMPATKKEKDMMLNHLASIGKRWNPATKTIEDVRWRANIEEEFYYVDCFGKVAKEKRIGLFLYSEFDSKKRLRRIVDDDSDLQMYNTGNYFKTEEAAERVAKQIREIFKKSKVE